MAAEYAPAAQLVQADAPLAAYAPAAHGPTHPDPPALAWYEPEGHKAQKAAPEVA